MKAVKVWWTILWIIFLVPVAQAQFLSIGGGGLIPQDLGSETAAGSLPASPRSEFRNGGIFTLDAGLRLFPHVTAGLHYSSSGTNLLLQRGDALGSSAELDLHAHTITFDTRVRTPFASGFRLYGLAGVGLTRFGLDVQREVGIPFPGGAPDSVTSLVFTYGGGVERHLRQLLHLKLEVRDYHTRIPDHLFRPGGSWHRLAVIGGLTIGL